MAVVAAASAVLVITGCAELRGGSEAWMPATPELPQEVHAVTTVLEVDSGPMLCLGPVAESYPPQCDGPPIVGWDWSTLDGRQTASGVTWGAYAVQGEWDGEVFTLTRPPVSAALHDPMVDGSEPDRDPSPDPWDESLPPGALGETEAERVRAELEGVVPGVLGSTFVNGRVLLEVRFDDGTLQSAVDDRFGGDAVVVISSLKPSTAGFSSSWRPERAELPAEATGHGLVIDEGDGARMCLGMVMESLPPQCEGPVVVGWDWDEVDGEEAAAGVIWGEYRVRGLWDGDVFTLDRQPVHTPLRAATHDPSAPVPSTSPDPACASSEARLPELRSAVPDIVSVMIDLADGCVVVGVEYDDGTLQAAVDERFGDGAIKIGSSFTPVDRG
jgi:hypothetical protein